MTAHRHNEPRPAPRDLTGRYLARHYDPTPQLRWKRNLANRAKTHPFSHLYNTAAWASLRAGVLDGEPLCRNCGKLADDVDHVIPHKGDRGLFHDRENLQPLCKTCHKAKTRMERRW